jgi:hypothetical protein
MSASAPSVRIPPSSYARQTGSLVDCIQHGKALRLNQQGSELVPGVSVIMSDRNLAASMIVIIFSRLRDIVHR